KQRLEETGVIQKDDKPDVRPWILRRLSDPAEIGTEKNLAQILQKDQQGRDSDAAQEGHGGKEYHRARHPEPRRRRRISRCEQSRFLRSFASLRMTSEPGAHEIARRTSALSPRPRA